MFNPSREQVRQFFCDIWHKYCAQITLSTLESMALKWILLHPEYHALLSNTSTALTKEFDTAIGNANPFLHLSMHLAITEQISIDQPPGIRALYTTLAQKLDSEHDGQHRIMACLGETLWQAQQRGINPDSAFYLECIQHQIAQLSC